MLSFQPVMLNLIQHPAVQRCTMRFRIKSGMTSYLLTCDNPFLFSICNKAAALLLPSAKGWQE